MATLINDKPIEKKPYTNTNVYTKENVSIYEYRMYKYLDGKRELKFIPRFYEYDKNKETMKTKKIDGMNIADMYGADFNEVPEKIIKKIRGMIKKLYDMGVIYPDITGYNFIEDSKSNIWMIDFEHSFLCLYKEHEEKLNSDQKDHLDFVRRFIQGEAKWNPYFL